APVGVAAIGGGVAVIDVAGRHLPARRQSRVFLHRAALGIAGDHRRIVGAGDGDGDVLGRGRALVVGHRRREGLGVALALGEVLVGGIVEGVGPLAGGGIGGG